MKFEVGKYYRFVGRAARPWWSKEMMGVLDGKPRKCTYYRSIEGDCFEANFEGVPIPSSDIGQFGWRWGDEDKFEEVQMEPIVGKRYWVDDDSEEGCIKDKYVSIFLGKSSKGNFVFESKDGDFIAWNYFVPIPDNTYEIVHKKEGKEIGRVALTEDQLKILGIS